MSQPMSGENGLWYWLVWLKRCNQVFQSSKYQNTEFHRVHLRSTHFSYLEFFWYRPYWHIGNFISHIIEINNYMYIRIGLQCNNKRHPRPFNAAPQPSRPNRQSRESWRKPNSFTKHVCLIHLLTTETFIHFIIHSFMKLGKGWMKFLDVCYVLQFLSDLWTLSKKI